MHIVPQFIRQSPFDKLLPLTEEAGNAVMNIYKEKNFSATFKKDKSPLTRADIASHRLITKGLQELTPDIPILSEESGTIPYEERKHWNIYWLIDPLDGTKEFIQHREEFTINIALVENGSPVIGVVHAPALELNYFAARNEGAFKQVLHGMPLPIRVSDYRTSKFKIVVSRSHAGDEIENVLKRIHEDYECVSIGSSLKLCLVAEGVAHLYPRLGPTMEWDTAAAQCIVEEAGGKVVDLSGNVLRYNKPDLLNPNFIVCGDPPYPWQSVIVPSLSGVEVNGGDN